MSNYVKQAVLFLFVLVLMTACNNKNQTQSDANVKKLELTCYNSQTEEQVDKECTEDEAIGYFASLPQREDTFISIVANETQAIQFMWIEENKCMVEITNDSEDMVFMQRYATYNEALEMLKTAYVGDINKLEGFTPVPVMEKTLDEILGIEEDE